MQVNACAYVTLMLFSLNESTLSNFSLTCSPQISDQLMEVNSRTHSDV